MGSRIPQEGEAGFATIDALVALTLVSSTLILSLQALSVAHRTAEATYEAREAKSLLAHLATTVKTRPGVWAGQTEGLSWRLEVAAHQGELCRREATLKSTRTARSYSVETLEPCPTGGEA